MANVNSVEFRTHRQVPWANATRTVALALGLGALFVTACSGGGSTPDATNTVSVVSQPDVAVTEPPVSTEPDTGDSTPPAAESTQPSAEPSRRIVALGEEFLLADLLAVGVTPVASTSNIPDGFVGLDAALVQGIEPIYSPDFNLERLAALRPDLLLVPASYLAIGVVSLDDLEAVAETAVLGEPGDDWRTGFLATAEAVGQQQRATEVLADVDARLATAGAVLAGREMSLASISPGPTIRVYTDGRTSLTEVLVEVGAVLRPDPSVGGLDDNGRLTISLEQLQLLDGEVLVLLQTSTVPGEDDALGDVTSSALWNAIPAVAADRVITLDRLAYPGTVGAAQFIEDLAAAVDQL
jgi:iron complex transport system substrate-binding protein